MLLSSCLIAESQREIWKAATYMKPRYCWGYIPTLKVCTEELTLNEDKAQAFMGTFFPKMAGTQEHFSTPAPPEIPWQTITELESTDP